MIRLFSIEDHWMVIDGLKSRFRGDRDDISITCTAETIDDALAMDSDLFDIILLDLLIPGTDPVDNVLKLKNRYPGKPIVILTSEEQTVWEDQMCEAGVQAYLTKHDKRKKIKAIIERVSLGEDLYKQKMMELKQLTILPLYNETPKLKPTQKAILTLFIKEMSLKEIASNTYMTESAVAKAMARMRKQFQVKSNTGLIRFFIDKKML